MRRTMGRVVNAAVVGVSAMLLTVTVMATPACAAPRGRLYVRVGPPAPVIAVRGSSPGVHYRWVDGYYRWSGARYDWVPGRWMVPPRPRAVWAPGRWVPSRRGWYWVDGRWRS